MTLKTDQVLDGETRVKDLGEDQASKAKRARRWRQAFRVTVWFFGVVIASLIPLASTYVNGADVNEAPPLVTLLGNGDLFITGTVVAVAGFVEIALSYKSIKSDK